MKHEHELPDGTLCVFANYIYVTPDGMSMGVTSIDGDALLDGKAICKGADDYESTEV